MTKLDWDRVRRERLGSSPGNDSWGADPFEPAQFWGFEDDRPLTDSEKIAIWQHNQKIRDQRRDLRTKSVKHQQQFRSRAIPVGSKPSFKSAKTENNKNIQPRKSTNGISTYQKSPVTNQRPLQNSSELKRKKMLELAERLVKAIERNDMAQVSSLASEIYGESA
jgi:hypothetical protein